MFTVLLKYKKCIFRYYIIRENRNKVLQNIHFVAFIQFSRICTLITVHYIIDHV